jgi:predicted NUDIX family phosphoesterase
MIKMILACNKDFDVLFAPRKALEDLPEYRQLIPYILFQHKDKYACFERVKGNEKRLANKKTIGVGGHIDIADYFDIPKIKEKIGQEDYTQNELKFDLLEEAIKREVCEETGFFATDMSKYKLIGNIAIDDTPVDCVHLGFVYTLEISPDELLTSMKEVDHKEIELLGYFTKQELKNMENLESWSKFVVENLI